MASERRSVLREGIVAGLIGAAVVAVWFFVYDLARGRPFHTPSLLGAFVFYGADTPAPAEPALGAILGYTMYSPPKCVNQVFGCIVLIGPDSKGSNAAFSAMASVGKASNNATPRTRPM